MKALLALSFLMASIITASGETPLPGPMGLSWGMSKADVEALGVNIGEGRPSSVGEFFNASKLPKVLADTESVQLFFGPDDKLWRLAAISKEHTNDRYGVQIRARFKEIQDGLDARYGTGKLFDRAPTRDYFRAPERWAYAVAENHRGYVAVWETADLMIELSARSSYEDTFYVLIYEFKALRDEVEKARKAEEKNAL